MGHLRPVAPIAVRIGVVGALTMLATCGAEERRTSSDTAVAAVASSATIVSETIPSPIDPEPTDPAPTDPVEKAPAAVAGSPAERSAAVVEPDGYDPSRPAPLIVALHGFTSNGDSVSAYFRLAEIAQKRGALLVHPDGTANGNGQQFWNATDACCNFGAAPVDDVSYLRSLIDQTRASHNVDPTRIVFVGHSNGGFMSYRMACEHADVIAGIVSLAGAAVSDPSTCRPSSPVSVIQIHGTADSLIAYDGGAIFGRPYPSARASVETWATHNGCSAEPSADVERMDLETRLPGSDTRVERYASCTRGTTVELWTIEGGAHTPSIDDTMFDSAIGVLLDRPKLPIR